jgi:hypothetical protein
VDSNTATVICGIRRFVTKLKYSHFLKLSLILFQKLKFSVKLISEDAEYVRKTAMGVKINPENHLPTKGETTSVFARFSPIEIKTK